MVSAVCKLGHQPVEVAARLVLCGNLYPVAGTDKAAVIVVRLGVMQQVLQELLEA